MKPPGMDVMDDTNKHDATEVVFTNIYTNNFRGCKRTGTKWDEQRVREKIKSVKVLRTLTDLRELLNGSKGEI